MGIVAAGMLGAHLDPAELTAFVAAVESGTISGAAESLELTQSAATKRLQSLERRIGVVQMMLAKPGWRRYADPTSEHEAPRAVA